MFHLVNNLTNKSGDALVGYYVKLKDSEGAYATLYADENSTPIATVSGETDAGITDAVGMYDIWVADGVYDVEFFDKNDITQLVSRVPAVPMYGLQSSADLAAAVTAAEVAQAAAEASVDAVQTDLASTDAGKGAEMVVGKLNASAAIARTLADKAFEFATFEDFGAVGDVQNVAAATKGDGSPATDDTAAIQAALDWAYGGGTTQPRAIKMLSKVYLVGALTFYPNTTIIGTGRMTSSFVCKTGTTGKWMSDRGNGAQKIMLSGFTAYGRGNTELTHVLELGNEGIQFGTQGILSNLWLRDAPNGYAYEIDANVGFFRDIVSESCRHGGLIRGNENMVDDLYPMQAGKDTTGPITGGPANVVGLEVYGCHIRKVEIEAISSGALPLLMNGDVRIANLVISNAVGATFSHLIEVSQAVYLDEWSIKDPKFPNGGTYTVTNGILKVGSTYYGGTNPNAVSNRDFVKSLNVYGGKFLLKNQEKTAFMLRVQNDAGTIKHRIGAPLSSSATGPFNSKINGASTTLTATPNGADASTAFAAGAKISSTSPSIILLDVASQAEADVMASAEIVSNSATTDYRVRPVIVTIDVNGVSRPRLGLQLYPRHSSFSPVNWATALGTAGWIMDIQVEAYLA